jgi:hypothetical protein
MGAITIQELKSLTNLAKGTVEVFESEDSEWLQATIDSETARVYAKLRKRYAVPFIAPVPTIVREWVAAYVDHRMLVKIGVSVGDVVIEAVKARVDATALAITDAAESVEGLTELPLNADAGASGVISPATFFYSETSPFRAWDLQLERGRFEDEQR